MAPTLSKSETRVVSLLETRGVEVALEEGGLSDMELFILLGVVVAMVLLLGAIRDGGEE